MEYLSRHEESILDALLSNDSLFHVMRKGHDGKYHSFAQYNYLTSAKRYCRDKLTANERAIIIEYGLHGQVRGVWYMDDDFTFERYYTEHV